MSADGNFPIESVTAADELPTPIPTNVELWSENYCFDAFDTTAGLGFWFHLGRWSKNPELWREQNKIFLPDGTVALWKTFGRRGEDQGPTAATLSMRNLEPGHRWLLEFDGPARRVQPEVLLQGALQDGPLEHLRFRFEFTSDRPIWQFGADAEHAIVFSTHYEQHGTAVGRLSIGDETFEMTAGSAFRDHSRGPRKLSDLQRHLWLHGQLEDGRAFAVFQQQTSTADTDLGRGCLIDGRNLVDARPVAGNGMLDRLGNQHAPFSTTIETIYGQTLVIETVPGLTVTSSFLVPYEKLHGVSPKAGHISIHQMATFTVDGGSGSGTVERAFAVTPDRSDS